MDLKNHRITVRELMANKKAKEILQKRFPKVMGHPMLRAADSLMLYQIVEFANAYVPKAVVADTLKELEQI